jgi:hypothetical protein
MRRSLVILLVAAIVAVAASVAILAAAPGNPQNGVGRTADVNPNGCTDCHNKSGGVDNSLAAVVKKSAPKHVAVKEDINNCYICHAKRADMGKIMHRSHLAEGNSFISTYGGSCTHCHRVDPKTGTVSVKGVKK